MSSPRLHGCLFGIDEETRKSCLRHLSMTAEDAWEDAIEGEGLDYSTMDTGHSAAFTERRRAFIENYNDTYAEKRRHNESTILALEGLADGLMVDYRELFLKAAALEEEVRALQEKVTMAPLGAKPEGGK